MMKNKIINSRKFYHNSMVGLTTLKDPPKVNYSQKNGYCQKTLDRIKTITRMSQDNSKKFQILYNLQKRSGHIKVKSQHNVSNLNTLAS